MNELTEISVDGHVTTWGEFKAANAGGMSHVELCEIETALLAHGAGEFGGGAAGTFNISLLEVASPS